jgi:hypothetical protein
VKQSVVQCTFGTPTFSVVHAGGRKNEVRVRTIRTSEEIILLKMMKSFQFQTIGKESELKGQTGRRDKGKGSRTRAPTAQTDCHSRWPQ